MRRRTFLSRVGDSIAGLSASFVATSHAQETRSIDELRSRWREWLAPETPLPAASARLDRSNREWRELLEPAQYAVLREEATEAPHTSPLNEERRPGVYVCVACDLALFTSAMKFDSGTGWPSFFTTIPDVFDTKRDLVWLIPRTEYHCAHCGGHHGHVFDDGPAPTHERWCNNGVALRFIPRDT